MVSVFPEGSYKARRVSGARQVKGIWERRQSDAKETGYKCHFQRLRCSIKLRLQIKEFKIYQLVKCVMCGLLSEVSWVRTFKSKGDPESSRLQHHKTILLADVIHNEQHHMVDKSQDRDAEITLEIVQTQISFKNFWRRGSVRETWRSVNGSFLHRLGH